MFGLPFYGFLILLSSFALLVALRGPSWGPWRWADWLRLALGLLVGGGVLYMVVVSLGYDLLEAAFPSYLLAGPDSLRVRVRRSSGNGLPSWSCTDLSVPRSDVKGVRLWSGQYEWVLFVVHSSGLAFSTGWHGALEDGMRIGKRLAEWVETAPPEDIPHGRP
ncbi:MAG: hypothetical protein HY928_10215 [Elusimicrobia bacterium]|nr:hypothetical protein [Elusimicrobiota bacterium]